MSDKNKNAVQNMYVMLCTKPWQCTHEDQEHLL